MNTTVQRNHVEKKLFAYAKGDVKISFDLRTDIKTELEDCIACCLSFIEEAHQALEGKKTAPSDAPVKHPRFFSITLEKVDKKGVVALALSETKEGRVIKMNPVVLKDIGDTLNLHV